MVYFYSRMRVATDQHSYRETGMFSNLILDYLADCPELRSLHLGLPSMERIGEAIQRRKQVQTDRSKLVEALRLQYATVKVDAKTIAQIDSLESENTFTVTTAHQCNLFLGPTYTIFKVLHTIKMADAINAAYPEIHVVPVFYMGSEDADLAELNHANVLGERLEWKTGQTGAVGRMQVDDSLIELIDQQQRILGSFPFGPQWIEQLRTAYQLGKTIAESTFQLLHGLFADRGLLILQADEASLKSSMQAIFWDELTRSSAAGLVAETDQLLQQNGYKNQAHPRPINLFYLQPGSRERIEKNGSVWQVSNSSVQWDESSLRAEWAAHPERFSPNVILRGIYQETILPNLVYIGGGGELAYWLQLRSVFDYHQVPFPLLQLRASFQWLDASMGSKMKDLQLKPSDLFKTTDQLLDERLDADVLKLLDLGSSLSQMTTIYEELRMKAKAIDPTLDQHVQALATRSLQRIEELQKKMKRAERRKYATRRIQIDGLKFSVFPGGGLQERYENLGAYYAVQGANYFDQIYDSITVWDNQFTWLRESD